MYSSCEKEDPAHSVGQFGNESNNLEVVVNGNSASNSAQFRRISDTQFMLNYITYKITDGHISVIGGDNFEIGAILKGEVVLCSSITIDGKKYVVRELADKAFYDFDNLIKIKVPNTIYKC